MDKNATNVSELQRLNAEIAAGKEDARLYFERGKIFWKEGEKSKAISDFNAAAVLDPDCGAREYLELANDIMNFYNTDLYNP